ncbi:hypothetical protein JCM19046_1576 [Bacillus sp. JCM 19046]|nr:hypothetical protein JCM19045_159 [Bacillus sp. JCM 19045]GAF17097.1 hypothetical protein JCM19046_1576 [Bacillus sp. JCM 19046]
MAITPKVVNWDGEVHLTWVETSQPPQQIEHVTSVHGFCFDGATLLLVDLNNRGWDVPGGHVEAGERPEESFAREAMEEGYVEGDSSLLGYIIVDHSHNANWNEKSVYPQVGYQLFYKMNITKVHPFLGEFESSRRLFISPDQVNQFYHGWDELYHEMVTCATKDK